MKPRLTLRNLSTSFRDWKNDRCKKNLHIFNDTQSINKDYTKSVITCTNCNLIKLS